MADALKAEVLNPDWIVDHSHLYPLAVGDYDYLIITDNEQWNAGTITPSGAVGDLVTTFTKLADWKKRRGLRTVYCAQLDTKPGLTNGTVDTCGRRSSL